MKSSGRSRLSCVRACRLPSSSRTSIGPMRRPWTSYVCSRAGWRRLPVLVVVTYRDDELDATHPLRIVLGDVATQRVVSRIPLAPLSIGAVATLAESSDARRGRAVPDHRRQSVLRHRSARRQRRRDPGDGARRGIGPFSTAQRAGAPRLGGGRGRAARGGAVAARGARARGLGVSGGAARVGDARRRTRRAWASATSSRGSLSRGSCRLITGLSCTAVRSRPWLPCPTGISISRVSRITPRLLETGMRCFGSLRRRPLALPSTALIARRPRSTRSL